MTKNKQVNFLVDSQFYTGVKFLQWYFHLMQRPDFSISYHPIFKLLFRNETVFIGFLFLFITSDYFVRKYLSVTIEMQYQTN